MVVRLDLEVSAVGLDDPDLVGLYSTSNLALVGLDRLDQEVYN